MQGRKQSKETRDREPVSECSRGQNVRNGGNQCCLDVGKDDLQRNVRQTSVTSQYTSAAALTKQYSMRLRSEKEDTV